MFGNLIENAMNAVRKLKPENRRVNVAASMLTEKILGISVENPFDGVLDFNADGLPVCGKNSGSERHGLGLISVSRIAARYGGLLKVDATDNVFHAAVILYCSELNL